jgi:AmmeMemoRadiSam system protein B
MSVRRPAVAGRFYPADADTLARTVDAMLAAVPVPDDEPLAAAYVVPHAGHRYSGPVAAHVYARLRRHAGSVQRVVLVGPSHFVRLNGAAVPSTTGWLTPSGEFPVDCELRDKLTIGGYAVADDTPHQREHSLEVQLPFLARALGQVPVLPVAVGICPVDNAVEIIDAAMTAAGDGAVLLCSTDFSHYHDHETAQTLDRRTAQAVLGLRPERIGIRDACGVFALRGTVGWALRHDLTPHLLDLRNSGDTYGNPERVVGYPAFAFHPGAADPAD